MAAMSLDLTKVAAQLAGMVAQLKTNREEKQLRLEQAMDTLHQQSSNLDNLKAKIAASNTTWLVADLVDNPTRRYPAPPLPEEFTVLATDGSHIDIDRHRSTRCYLINVGTVVLKYGLQPGATLDNNPYLGVTDEDLFITEPGNPIRQIAVDGALLGITRSLSEYQQLVSLATAMPLGGSSLALIDGTLILWGLEGYPDFVTELLLDNGVLQCLDALRKLNQDRQLALASYISFPRSNDLVNALRLAICPHEIVDSDRLCKECTTRECEAVTGVQDRDLFTDLLQPGERSARFISQSKIVTRRYHEHRIHFFYLNVDDEIARVEIPQWVANDKDLLNLTHGLVLDQCRRGQGYPVALSEAHERAVITGADRESFWHLVEASLAEEHLPMRGSAKSLSKRTRWI